MIIDWIKIRTVSTTILILLLTIATGLWCVNQALEYRYKSEFLQKPCELCARLNPAQGHCIEGCFTYQISTQAYPEFQQVVQSDNLTFDLTNLK